MPSNPARTKKLSLVLNLTVLGIDSGDEPITQSALNYRNENVYKYLQSKGFSVSLLQGPLARRHYTSSKAKDHQVIFLTGVGHGAEDLFMGDHGDVIFQIGNYHPDEIRGKIVHLLSCQTARRLGPDFIRNGCQAFFGYDEDFTFLMSDKDIFFECDSEIDRAFADGLSASQVYNRVRRLFDQMITELRTTGKLYMAAMLEYDRDHLRCPSSGGKDWGDIKAKMA